MIALSIFTKITVRGNFSVKHWSAFISFAINHCLFWKRTAEDEDGRS